MTIADVERRLVAGLENQRAGDAEKAESLYREALKLAPGHIETHALLGMILLQAGRHREALPHLKHSAAAHKGKNPNLETGLGMTLQALGQPAEAATHFKQALAHNPGNNAAQMGLGRALLATGYATEAEQVFQNLLGTLPNNSEVLNELAQAYERTGRTDEAEGLIDQIVNFNPDQTGPHLNRALFYGRHDRIDEMCDSLEKALSFAPENIEILVKLAEAQVLAGNSLKARETCAKALNAQTQSATALVLMASLAKSLRQNDDALALFNKALEIEPDNPTFLTLRGLLRLAIGDFHHGWSDYEHRWESDGFPNKRLKTDKPQWIGENLAGKTLFIHYEQGLGDSIQFIRYAVLAKAEGARTIVFPQPGLEELFQTAEGVDQVIGPGDPPDFDVYSPMLSLPWALKATADTPPVPFPYLHPDPVRVDAWKKHIPDNGALRVGFVWQGNKRYGDDAARSVTLEMFHTLFSMEGTRFFSLQKETEPGALDDIENVIDLGRNFKTFADTAAAISHLDLVISVDTSVAHMAGALGKPLWILIPYQPDWRWGIEGETTPWYPHARLFRQASQNTWPEVFERLHQALKNQKRA